MGRQVEKEVMKISARKRELLLYGALLAIFLFVLKWLQLRFIIVDHAMELYTGTLALLFTALGVWVAIKITRVSGPRIDNGTSQVSNENFTPDPDTLHRYSISKRELEVLELMAIGLSNQDIADRLFVSLSTIKTHSRNLFEKLDVARRTQAIDKARKLGILP